MEAKHNYFVIRSKIDFVGERFPVSTGEQKVYRFLSTTPKMVLRARNNQSIEWGGSAVSSDNYEILFDGEGWKNCKTAIDSVNQSAKG